MATLATKPVQAPLPRKRSRGRILRLAVSAFLVFAILAADLYLRSASFRERVRQKIVAELEQVTGGQVVLGSFRWSLPRLEFEAFNLTIRGREASTESPYIHLDHIAVRIRVISLLGKEIALSSVKLDRPTIHLIVYPDGSSNAPAPKITHKKAQASPSDSLFEMAMDHVAVENGSFRIENRAKHADLAVNGITVAMDFDSSAQQYHAAVKAADIFARGPHLPPLAATAGTAIVLGRNSADVTFLRVATPRSFVEVSGSVEDFSNPRLQALYKASIDIPEAASFLQVKNWRQGKLNVDGAGSFYRRQFAASGKMEATELDYARGGMRLRDAAATAQYVVTPTRIDLNRLALQAFGGHANGGMHLVYWLDPMPLQAQKSMPEGKPASPAQAQGSMALEISGFHAGKVLEMFAAHAPALVQMRLSAGISGSLNAHWLGSPANAAAELAASMEPDPASGGGLPLTGSMAATYNGESETAQVTKLDLTTRSSHIVVSGNVPLREGASSALQLRVTASDLSEFQPLFRALGAKGQIPLQLVEPASFTGTLSGPLASPRLRGTIALGAFDTILNSSAHADASAAGTPLVAQWDRFAADLEYSRSHIGVHNAQLQQGTATVAFDAEAQTTTGVFDRSSALNVRLAVQGASVASIESLAGYDYPIDGTISARGQLSGSLSNMSGSGSLHLSGGSFYGEPYRSLQAQLQFSGEEAQFSDLVFVVNSGVKVTGSGAYNPNTGRFNIAFAGKGIDLASVRRLQERTSVAGKVQFQAAASGSFDHPALNADLHLHGLSIGGHPVGEANLTAVTQDSDLKLQGTTELEGAKLALDGHIGLGGDYPADVTVQLDHFDAVPVLRLYASPQIKGSSDIAGMLHVSGPLRNPKQLAMEGSATQFAVTLQGYQIKSDGPLRLVLSNQVLRVDQFHVVGEDTDFHAQGSIDFTTGGAIDISSEGEINLRLLRTLDPNIYSSGKTTFTLNGRGTVADPRLFGNVKFESVQIALIDLPNGLSNMNGTLFFNQDRLQIRQLTAETGGGTIDIGGYIAYRNGLFADLTASGKSIRVRYPTGLSTVASANFKFTGTTGGGVLGGGIDVEKFSVTPQFDLLAMIAHSRESVSVAHASTVLDNIHLDLHVGAASELAVDTSLARLKGDLDLHIGGTLARPLVLGRANIFEGDVDFNGTKYHLERGDVVFNNPVVNLPVLNVQASARVQSYDVTLGFEGPVDKLNMTYRSDPPLPTADIISLVALGKTQEGEGVTTQTQQNTQSMVENDSGAILGEALNATINSRVQKLFGGSRVKIDPDIGGSDTDPNPGTHLTVEQQVSNRMTFTYVTNLTQTAEQVIQMEYAINSHLSIMAVRDQNGIVGLSFKVRRRKK